MWGRTEERTPVVEPRSPAIKGEEGKSAHQDVSVKNEPAVSAEPSVPNRSAIGKSILIKAEISGSEDLYIDGELEGSVELPGSTLTVGPNGKVSANVVARNLVVHGTLRGNVVVAGKVEIRKTGSLLGDLTTAGVTIEDGAYFKGSIDIVRQSPSGGEPSRANGQPAVPAVAPAAAVS